MDDFDIAPDRHVVEDYPSYLDAEEVPLYLSRLKADAHVPFLHEGDVLLTADTIVLLDGEILGKPRDEAEARDMLRRLSGRTHRVVTGVTLASKERQETFKAVTDVTFDEIPPKEIAAYVKRFQPLDKAGAYGIQEWMGAANITRIEGSFYNVMGLPLHLVHKHLASFG